jgi:hypothetical protein
MSTIARFNPLWEQVKVGVDSTRVFEDDFVEIAGDFEGANAHNIRKLDHNHYYVETEPEPGSHKFSGEGYYVCFGIHFKDPSIKSVRIRFYSVGEANTNHRGQIGKDTEHCIIKYNGEYHQLPRENIIVVDQKNDVLDFIIPQPEGADTVFVMNFHWWAYSEGIHYFNELCARTPGMSSEIIGTSIQGRPLYAYEFGSTDPKAHKILITQTMQPSEMGNLIIKLMVDFLVSDDPAARNILRDFRFHFVPYGCPDGSVLGLCVSNSRGDFVGFLAHKAARNDPAAPPEAVAIYRYIEKVKPLIFYEMHSNNWAWRKGHMLIRYRHYLIPDPEKQRLWDHLEERLLELDRMYHENWTDEYDGYYQVIIGFQAALNLGVISSMIKMHDRFEMDILRHDAIDYLKVTCSEVRKWKNAKKFILP